MTTPVEPRTLMMIQKIHGAVEGEANDEIVAACNYIIANAVAILAHDRPDAKRMLKICEKAQRELLDGCWDQVRAKLAEMKLL